MVELDIDSAFVTNVFYNFKKEYIPGENCLFMERDLKEPIKKDEGYMLFKGKKYNLVMSFDILEARDDELNNEKKWSRD
jgi:hypothetical protein